MLNRMIKFTQVAVAGNGDNLPDLFALDGQGRVWAWNYPKKQWNLRPNPTEHDALSQQPKEQSHGEERSNT